MKQNPLQESPRKPQEFREPLPRSKELTFTNTKGSESNEFKWHESSSSSEEQVSIVTVKMTPSYTLASIERHSIWSDTLWMFQMKGALTQGIKLSSDVIVNYWMNFWEEKYPLPGMKWRLKVFGWRCSSTVGFWIPASEGPEGTQGSFGGKFKFWRFCYKC